MICAFLLLMPCPALMGAGTGVVWCEVLNLRCVDDLGGDGFYSFEYSEVELIRAP